MILISQKQNLILTIRCRLMSHAGHKWVGETQKLNLAQDLGPLFVVVTYLNSKVVEMDIVTIRSVASSFSSEPEVFLKLLLVHPLSIHMLDGLFKSPIIKKEIESNNSFGGTLQDSKPPYLTCIDKISLHHYLANRD